QRLLADPPHTARRQLHPTSAALDITLSLQLRRQLAHLIRGLPGISAEQLLQLRRLLRRELPSLVPLAQGLLEIFHGLQPFHQGERFLERQRLRSVERVATTQSRSRRKQLQLRGQFSHLLLQLRVVKRRGEQIL